MRARRWSVVIVGAVLLAGCSGGSDGADDTDVTSATTAADGTTVPGTKLELGDAANVRFSPDARHQSVIRVRVRDVEAGRIGDLREFKLNDDARRSNVYYVDLAVENMGRGDIGGEFVAVFGRVSKTMVIQPVSFGSRFARCDYRPLPKRFEHGDRTRTCVVLLAPDHGTVTDIEWRFDGGDAPISWSADVAD